MNRRQFLRDSALASASVALMGAVRFAAHAESTLTDSRIEVLLDEPLGTISPNIYGHFAENLSGVLYDGVWVGTGSKVPNVDGLRKDLIEQMRKIKAGSG
jgi:alpha-N-arabinofuranosidase